MSIYLHSQSPLWLLLFGFVYGERTKNYVYLFHLPTYLHRQLVVWLLLADFVYGK